MKPQIISAIFRRNFSSYFANPTGYVFICVFVLLSSIAAFWTHEFFTANLANLDQLNKYLPYILLVFIPAITMSVWAEERRQGTDELLLTLPAGDFDVVLGKYLATVAIYSVALAFSAVCNFAVLSTLGSPDVGLFFGTYVGYWFVGLAMLAIGMVASFLTGNLTVGFVLGALFNAPLAFASSADVIPYLPLGLASSVENWSLEAKFRDFGRGVISLASIAYFLLIVASMLYLCMVLIGRRHWAGGRDGRSLAGHYFFRAVALAAIAVGVVVVAERNDARLDVTAERLSSLAPETRTLMADLEAEHPVRIDAFISPEVPESYVQTRLNLISTLRELEALGGDRVQVQIHATEPLSEESDRAETQYGITSRPVSSRSRGAWKRDEIFMGVAISSGLNKVVVPFFDRGIPAEFELVRGINTVCRDERKKLGVLTTDARLFGGFDPATMQPSEDQPIIDELKKQYNVVQVDASQPITEKFDVLLAVQPSSLNPDQMDNFVAAVRGGQPTVIFEDPFPLLAREVPATAAPKQPPGGMMGMMQRQMPEPKGDVSKLWNLLGVNFSAEEVVWQAYTPHKQFEDYPGEFVFIDDAAGEYNEFTREEPIVAGMQELLFPFPGFVSALNTSKLKFKELVLTGNNTGTVPYNEILSAGPFGGGGGLNPSRPQTPTRVNYVLAARITGAPEAETKSLSKDAVVDETTEKAKEPEINVVLVADIDVLYPDFFMLRAMGEDPENEFYLNVDNVAFVLNAIDALAGEDEYVAIRSRRRKHRVLETIERQTKEAQDYTIDQSKKLRGKLEQRQAEFSKEMNEEVQKLRARTDLDDVQKMQTLAMTQQRLERKHQTALETERKRIERDVKKVAQELELQKERVRQQYRLWAVALPPIPPLLIGLAVFFQRRVREREGVSRSRLR